MRLRQPDLQRPSRVLRPPGSPAGQSLVEFSLMLVFLTVLLMGVLDLGRAYFTYLALKDAASEGAYFASAFPQCTEPAGVTVARAGGASEASGPGCADPNNVVYRVINSSPRGGLIDWADRSVAIATILPCGSTVPCPMVDGEVLTVSVRYRYQMITPFVGAIANGQELTLRASSSAVIVRVPNCSVAPCN
jgi:Flp pilus assembly protein TadG